MFILFILLWVISFLIIVQNPKSEINRWFAAITFLSGCGGLANVIDVYIIPCFAGDVNAVHITKLISGFINSLSHYFAPFAFFMFCICYSGLFSTPEMKRKVKLAYLTLIPLLVLYGFFPLDTSFNPYSPDATLAKILSILMLMFAIPSYFLLMYSYITEKNPKTKRERGLIVLMAIPTTVVIFFTSYILTALNVKDSWKYNILVIIYMFALFIYFAARYGILGCKLKYEKYRLGIKIKTMISQTEVLNEVIKNEVAKIALNSDSIKAISDRLENNSSNRKAFEDLEILSNSTKHVLEMISTILEHSQDIVLKDSVADVANIINNCLNEISLNLKNESIIIKKQMNYTAEILCDVTHIREVINNVLKNAIDATKLKGDIDIWTETGKKWFTIVIKDTGIGIAKENIPHILDPFFTTRNRKQNFGLGLTYCYNVMQKHGGILKIDSEENVGTTVSLNFPRRRVLRLETSTPENIDTTDNLINAF